VSRRKRARLSSRVETLRGQSRTGKAKTGLGGRDQGGHKSQRLRKRLHLWSSQTRKTLAALRGSLNKQRQEEAKRGMWDSGPPPVINHFYKCSHLPTQKKTSRTAMGGRGARGARSCPELPLLGNKSSELKLPGVNFLSPPPVPVLLHSIFIALDCLHGGGVGSSLFGGEKK